MAIGDPDPIAETSSEAGDPDQRSRSRRRRRYLGLAMLALGALIMLAGLWVAVTGALARNQLASVRDELGQLHAQIAAGDLSGAEQTAQSIASHAHRAHELTAGPAWAAVSALPDGGAPFETIRVITDQVDVLGHDALPEVVTASQQLDPKTLRRPNGTIDLARLSTIAPVLDRADVAVDRAIDAVRRQPDRTWLSPVDSARTSLLTKMTSLQKSLRSADLTTHIAPAMLGGQGVKRYFVAFQNEAEARGTGGIPGAFGILRARDGRLSFERFESDAALDGVSTNLNFGHDYNQLLAGGRSTTAYVNSDLTPQFPYAARIWMAMWQNHAHQKLDGAIALDPTALSYLLRVTGGASLPDGTQVTADNVVSLTESTVYAKFSKPQQRDKRQKYLLAIARTVSKRLVNSSASTTALVKAGAQAATERRLLVYSTDPAVEADLSQTSLAGVIPNTNRPYIGAAVVNVGGNKLDYYLDRHVSWRRTGCGSTRQVVASIRLTNTAPAHGLSHYVTERQDYPGYPTKPGDNRLAVYYYATEGATLESLAINGRPSTPSAGELVHHPVFAADVELPRGTTRIVTFRMQEPAASGAPIVLEQPLVRPLTVTVKDQHCS